MLGAGRDGFGPATSLGMGWMWQRAFTPRTGVCFLVGRFCSSQSSIRPPVGCLGVSPCCPLSRGDLGAAPPSDPISSSFPQERLGDGPRQSVRTPCAMASSELPPCPAVGTVTSRSWVFWGEESQPCAGRGDITPFPVVLEPHSTTRPRGAIAGVFGWRCSLPYPASLSALWGKSVPG